MTATLADLDAQAETIARKLARLSGDNQAVFQGRLDLSWIYHDNAIEGLVLSYQDLKAAIDDRIISDATLIPAYDEIRRHKQAIETTRELATRKKAAIAIDTLKKLYLVLTPDAAAKPSQYRKDNPLHRQYFHEIAPPDKISYLMRRLTDWLGSEEARRAHPIRRAARAHFKLMQVFPWTRNSGKVARLLMNLILLREGYLPAIIHAIDRQRYYESLRMPPGVTEGDDEEEADALTPLVIEALASANASAVRFLEEAREARSLRVA